MTFWIFLWKAVLILGLAIFTGMAVWVAIGGYKDIRNMLSQVNKDQEDQD